MELILLVFLFYFIGSVIHDIGTRDEHFNWRINLMIDMSGLLLTIGLLVKMI